MKKVFLLILFIALFIVSSVFGDTISWTDWTSATSTSASGTIAGSITVSFTATSISFAQLGSGTNYWTEGTPPPYTGNSIVDNPPTPAEMIALNEASANSLTFSQPISNPIMAIVSQGQLGLPVSYDFDQSFTVLSEGQGYWGDGYYNLLSGDILQGYELHAAIQFNGTFSIISWTNTTEYWHGFTIGKIEPLAVSVDIKPGSDPNGINLKSKGVIPVAVLTTDDFDATIVDGATVQFEGASPVHDGGHLEDVDGDGDIDWVGHFKVRDTGIETDDTEASLTGETTDGTSIKGTDSIKIAGAKSAPSLNPKRKLTNTWGSIKSKN
jgi:hypothetical protein